VAELGLGMMKRVGQAEREFKLTFNDFHDAKHGRMDLYTYFQVDGEFFKARNL
jgi:hypothetical protein